MGGICSKAEVVSGPKRTALGLAMMWVLRLDVPLCVSVVVAWGLVWLGCGLPALFEVFFDVCGHNAYIWLLPACVFSFGFLGFFQRCASNQRHGVGPVQDHRS